MTVASENETTALSLCCAPEEQATQKARRSPPFRQDAFLRVRDRSDPSKGASIPQCVDAEGPWCRGLRDQPNHVTPTSENTMIEGNVLDLPRVALSEPGAGRPVGLDDREGRTLLNRRTHDQPVVQQIDPESIVAGNAGTGSGVVESVGREPRASPLNV